MFEVIWHVLFGEADMLPIRGQNPDLPLFLRSRDVDSESWLPVGSQFMSTVHGMALSEEEMVAMQQPQEAAKEPNSERKGDEL
jgi:hypothetical protein